MTEPGRNGSPQHLRCDYRANPIGLDSHTPRLSWWLDDTRTGARQSAYRVLVASQERRCRDEDADIWDSGIVRDPQSTHVAYGGPALESRRRYWWTVRTWDQHSVPSPYASPAWWEMGLLEATDWHARWISSSGVVEYDGQASGNEPCRSLLFRRRFALAGTVRRARVYASGLGCYEFSINGRRVSQDVFSPGWTVYEKRIEYQTYDVTDLLLDGQNVLGAVLGSGWWAGGLSLGRGRIERTSQGNPRLLAQLEIEFADGTRRRIVTDREWCVLPSPILENSFYHGETHDARLEISGWDRAGFDDRDWLPALLLDDPVDRLVAQQTQPIRVTANLPATAVTEPHDGVHIFDFGQNHAGRARLKVRGERGTRVQVRFAETLQPNGELDRRNLVGARSTDQYVLKGDGEEIWEPRFTYRGYRYAELTGYPGTPPAEALVSRVLHTAAAPAGRFECSSDLLNRIQHNILWALRSNLMSVPTDCPQRDERLGWLGDAHVIAPTACWNFDLATFFTKWLRDIRDSQHETGYVYDVAPAAVVKGPAAPGWGDALVGIPWTLHRFYGDARVIEENYDAMRAWVEYMRSNAPGHLYVCRHNLKEDGYGDWVAPVESPRKPIAAAFFYYSADLLARMAAVIGRHQDAERYGSVAQDIRTAFIRAYFDADANRFEGGTQMANLLPLAFGLAPSERRAAILNHVVSDIEARDTHLSTGFLGTAYALPLLSDNGHHELAYRLATQRTCPSWGYMVECGATTMCELWNPDTGDPRMNSWNHFALGTIGQWFYEELAGIHFVAEHRGSGAASHRFLIRPRPVADLTWVNAEHESAYGTVRSAWRREPDCLRIDVTIPANTTARICVPTPEYEDAVVTASGTTIAARSGCSGETHGLTFREFDEQGFAIFDAVAGSYSFAARRSDKAH